MALSSLSLRLISSAILIPVVVCVIAIGEWAFIGFAGLSIVIALYEWINISKHMTIPKVTKCVLSLAGLLYLGFSFFEMTALREQPNGLYWTIIFMQCIWASDSGAYLFGKTIGGPKMSPTISPNKTWSGYVGALLFPAIILLLGVTLFFDRPLFLDMNTILFGLAIGMTGQSGDLMISAMKRKAGLKDTGAIIPGHGGILDRIDALLLALPVFMAYIKFATE